MSKLDKYSQMAIKGGIDLVAPAVLITNESLVIEIANYVNDNPEEEPMVDAMFFDILQDLRGVAAMGWEDDCGYHIRTYIDENAENFADEIEARAEANQEQE